MSKPACMAPTASASSMTRAAWNWRSTSGAAPPAVPTTPPGRGPEPYLLEGEGAEAPRQVHRLHGCHRDPVGRRRDEDLGDAAPAAVPVRLLRTDEEVVGLAGGLDGAHGAAQHDVVPVAAQLDAGAPDAEGAAELGDVPRRDLGSGQQPRDHVGV